MLITVIEATQLLMLVMQKDPFKSNNSRTNVNCPTLNKSLVTDTQSSEQKIFQKVLKLHKLKNKRRQQISSTKSFVYVFV